MTNAAFQKIIDNLSETKGVQTLLESFQKLNSEIKKKESQLKNKFDKKKDQQIELAWKKYQEIVKLLSSSEIKLEKGVNRTVAKIKKSADDLEKNMVSYRKKALAQKNKLEKVIFKKTSKKASSKKASSKSSPVKAKKASGRKVAKKTTKKKA